MYAILKTKFNPFYRLGSTSRTFLKTRPLIEVKSGLGLCTGCPRNQSESLKLYLSTMNERNRKKRAKKRKNYCELLVVSDGATKQEKASIQKLTWNDIKLLANTNLNLSELHKLRTLPTHVEEHTYNNLVMITTPEVDNAPVKDQNAIIVNNVPVQIKERVVVEKNINKSDAMNFFRPEVIEEADQLLDVAPSDISDEGRHEVALKTLSGYLEICSILRNPARGLKALNFHNNRVGQVKDKAFLKIKNVKVYNALLKGFAAKGDVMRLEEVLKIIRAENIKLNVQSYIAILECYGRCNLHEHYLKTIRIHAKDAANVGITFDRLLNRGVFLNDEREIVLQVMKKCDLNYKPKYWEPKTQYDNELVNSLNDPEQLVQPEPSTTQNPGLFTGEMLKSRIKQQLQIEKSSYISIKSIQGSDVVGADVPKYRQIMEQHFKDWEVAATKAFLRDLSALTAQISPLNHEPYMRSIPVKDFVTIIIDEAKKMSAGSETYSPTSCLLHKDLGYKVYNRFKLLRKQKTGVLDKIVGIHEKYCEDYGNTHEKLGVLPIKSEFLNTRQKWQWLEYESRHQGPSLVLDHRSWTPTIMQTIGRFLYRIIMHDLKIDVNSMRVNGKNKNYLPAFYTIFRSQGRIVKEEVKPHPVLSRLYRAAMLATLTFPASDLPMLCPPIPWTSIVHGGYLIAPCDVVRLPSQATLQQQRLYAAKSQHLYPALDALNQLGTVPWKVNKSILDVIINVFQNGGSAKLDVPESPENLPVPVATGTDKTHKFKLFKLKLQHKRKKAEMYSLWCDCLYRLSLANHYRDEIFWLPHNMDFRGRVYPIPPHLNHLGSDLARSILVFAEGRPLGPEGLNWLKIHLINLTGLKKRDSIRDRLAYANQITDEIFDSAEKPLTGRQWWAQSDEPWQTLACAMEIVNAIKSGDPENYICHFPVHQDGSCNGLQHYAALGRDSSGAYSVNLTATDVPQDVYSAVVSLVEEQRVKDALSGLHVAKILKGFVQRKVIKQTIMTTVYGVTRFGARLQIARQLRDIDTFPKESVWAASSYLTGLTFDSLRTMFTSTREIQDWFTECAKLIAASGQHVEWATPLDFPIVQPYIRFKNLQTSMIYKSFHMDQFEKPNVMKQKNAFAPNFVHSLDSTHMMLTSLYCERSGITFVSVHDCFWTHPSTVHIMNKICRDQFVALHSQPILEKLSTSFIDRFNDNPDVYQKESCLDVNKYKMNQVLGKQPKTGDFDLNQVLQSTYFFS